jgi:hypothetical protein
MRVLSLLLLLVVCLGVIMLGGPVDAGPCHSDREYLNAAGQPERDVGAGGGSVLPVENLGASGGIPAGDQALGGYSCCHVAAPVTPVVMPTVGPLRVRAIKVAAPSDWPASMSLPADIYRPPTSS